MLLTLVPLFNEKMAVCAYSFFTQRENYLLNPLLLGTAQFDGASQITGLELIQKMGIDTLSQGKEIFVPITNISIFADITEQCDAPHEKIVLLIDNTIPPIEMYVNRLKELKQQGYKLAIRKLAVSDFENYREVLKLMDYVLLNNRKIAIDKAKIYFGKLFPNISLCAGNIDTMEDFERLKETGGYRFYEGKFYRVPITKGQTDVAPLKGNYIDLLNIVNSPDFELTTAADIISRDTALTIDLLKMVQPLAVNSEITSIRHAAAMLGQRELKKWINTAVANALYADKPNEVTRLSLLRAKFAENLAEAFGLKAQKDELFLMGLFWKKTTNRGAIIGVLISIPVALLLKFLPIEMPFLDQMMYTFLLTMVTIGMVSLATCKTDDDPKGLVLTSEMFKTDKVFNICAYVICILLAVIYTACW